MPDLADLFPGFASHWIDTQAGRIFARSGGSGPPLLLLHGFPQTHVMWHRIAPAMAEHFSVVLMDLRGYGWSSAPRSDAEHRTFSKRAMAEDAVAVMAALGHARFRLAGHDRGARVGYRLALDHPGRLERLAVLDIVPTLEMWAGMDAARAMATYHWLFLAQPESLPETLIGGAPIAYLEHTLASWTAAKTLDAFDPRALAHYRAAFAEPSRIHAACEDYRAGAGVDRADDAADREAGRRILCPLFAAWGVGGFPAKGRSTLEVWREWAADVSGAPIEGGHFLPEENPAATAAALVAFLRG
ncbi:alpha/beta fold hydrolase [Labrys wisconsinensis]|uniref:Haloacetate dehalogenase n=1 Tax=Labrys wisconsinensis TaxID=425677 RepID=A0ABU0JP68_9HYPH|nr:alpha/beta hydrolase [Labrys wisconsinensis]MDQ0474947.1 haloacetate dehalogenase [Labrys wisconsinensis]